MTLEHSLCFALSLVPGAIFAQFDERVLRHISEGWHTRGASGSLLVTLLFVLVAIVLAGVWIGLRRSEQVGRLYSHRKLFAELCQAHAITRAQRGLLKSIAALAQAPHPTLLFVRRDLFEAGLDDWRRKYPNADLGPLEELIRKLFTSVPQSVGKSGQPAAT